MKQINIAAKTARVTSKTKAPYLCRIKREQARGVFKSLLIYVHRVERFKDNLPSIARATVVHSDAKKSSDFATGKHMNITNFDAIERITIEQS
jgi:hypothetical protein